MIPLELFTMGASALLGGVLKHLDRKADQQERLLDRLDADRQTNRDNTNPHYQWTRRTIALTVTFAVMVLPKLAALAGYPVSYGAVESTSYLFGLFGTSESTVWYYVGGMPITPLDTHAFASIIGLYFGAGRSR